MSLLIYIIFQGTNLTYIPNFPASVIIDTIILQYLEFNSNFFSFNVFLFPPSFNQMKLNENWKD